MKILKQHNVGLWLGAYLSQLGNGTFYVSFVNTLIIQVMGWHTTYGETLVKWFPWLNFGLFTVLIMIAYLAIFPWVDYVLVNPSRIAFQNKQGYKHQSPFRTDIEIVKADVKAMQKDIKKLLGEQD
jgi:hypothetical protein